MGSPEATVTAETAARRACGGVGRGGFGVLRKAEPGGERERESRENRRFSNKVQAEQKNGSANLALSESGEQNSEKERRSRPRNRAALLLIPRREPSRDRRNPPEGEQKARKQAARTCRRGTDAEGEPVELEIERQATSFLWSEREMVKGTPFSTALFSACSSTRVIKIRRHGS